MSDARTSADPVTQDMIDKVCAGMGNQVERDAVWNYITKLKAAIDAWRTQYEPRCAESCWQMDSCVINAPELVEEIFNVAGYYDGE